MLECLVQLSFSNPQYLDKDPMVKEILKTLNIKKQETVVINRDAKLGQLPPPWVGDSRYLETLQIK